MDHGIGFVTTRFDLRQQLLYPVLRAAELLLKGLCVLVDGLVLVRQPLLRLHSAPQVILKGIDLSQSSLQLFSIC
ncbi:hypothetical protein BL241_20340 [Ralstonia solanacearum]|uniref:Uncharacterized protein n=1 Tax=Ralstonia solanacearum TaxID=305 RepID=A0A0S4U1H7_RALSL|nr:hypothetical protein [Ralstonia solanacearum]NKA70161.1 hypothetical protein [Ralstonia solanacearum]NKA86161.1 hypothetical protein [Ralstonia solanacearum]NKF57471.1 hypothetical protein [Ralstonia solanacearum]NKF62400.1 hypothetical protein [Ralstonia solanacearum]